jgi:hypothetical protein
MRTIPMTAALAVLLTGWVGAALADPDKDESGDESGKGRWHGGYERFDDRGRGEERGLRFNREEVRDRDYGYNNDQPRWRRDYDRRDEYDYGYAQPRQLRAFKEEYDDGDCKIERKLEASGQYKEEVKCRGGRPSRGYSYYGYRY